MRSSQSSMLIAVFMIFIFSVPIFGQDNDEITQGALRVLSDSTEKLELPLTHTSVDAKVSGFLASVEVTQFFNNPMEETIEAVYVFPLPQNAAVDDMLMKIGDRTIKGVMKKRDEAREMYERAKAQGQTASLLEQERPNIFTQSIANILPGDSIQITIHYMQVLKYDYGQYEFVFPMVVGPRFIPGNTSGRSGEGWADDTDRVPDASRITPPVLTPTQRSGHDIDLTLSVDAGVPIHKMRSVSHQIEMKREGKSKVEVTIASNDTIPNKDFIFRYNVAGDKPETAMLTHHGENGGFFMLLVQPKANYALDEITPKEMIFVVDCSGSMSGQPIKRAKDAMKQCITGMNPKDSFQIIRFSESASAFSPKPLPNTPENITRALGFIEALQGQGGTHMLEGIKAALDYPHDPERMRIVFFMTDGYIGNENEILSAINKKLGNARLFSFGVGSSVNRFLLERMAEVGRGTVQYVRQDEDTKEAVTRFYERISKPYLTDISIDWNGLKVVDVYPQRIPDLFSAQPVIIHGRYKSAGKASITINGLIAGKKVKLPVNVELPTHEPAHKVLSTLWARTKIKDLMDQMYRGEKDDLVKEVTDIALKYKIISKYTSFVAVEEQIRREGDKIIKVVIPVEIPDGVEYEGVFGEQAAGFSKSSSGYPMSSMAAVAPKARARVQPKFADISISREEECDEEKVITVPRVEVRIDQVMVIGEIEEAEIIKKLKKFTLKIKAAFLKEVQVRSAQSGHIVVWCEVSGNGKIRDLKLKMNTVNSKSIEKQLVNLVKQTSFPAPRDGAKAFVTISFAFDAE